MFDRGDAGTGGVANKKSQVYAEPKAGKIPYLSRNIDVAVRFDYPLRRLA
jgi:hypothetical protein